MSNHLMVTGSAYVADKKYYGFWLGCLSPPHPHFLWLFQPLKGFCVCFTLPWADCRTCDTNKSYRIKAGRASISSSEEFQSSTQLGITESCRPALWFQRRILTALCSVQTQGDHRGSPTHCIIFSFTMKLNFLCYFFVLVFVFAISWLCTHCPPQDAALFFCQLVSASNWLTH